MEIVFGHHLTLKCLGGGEKWIINTANELARRGHDVEIYSTPLKVAGGIPNDKLDELLNGIPYKEAYRHSIKGDVCYLSYHPMTGLNYSTSGKVIKGIHATSCWEPINLKYGFLPVQAQLLHKLVGGLEFKTADAIHTVAPYLPINHRNVYKIPNYVDSSIFKPCQKPNKFVVTYASRKSYQKGWDTFQQVQRSLDCDPDIIFKTSGNISESDMPNFLASSHVGIVPSRYDSFGLSIVEFLMTGTPVITTPLLSHTALNLTLYFSDKIEYICQIITSLKQYWEQDPQSFLKECEKHRQEALKYDKKPIMDRIENMFIEVLSK
jgi:glycosyltransferase involved in cell wall biosynthesis